MRWYYLLIVFSFFVSCNPYSERDREYMDFMEHQTSFIRDKYGLVPYSLGGFNEEGLQGYSVSFRSDEIVDLDRARVQIINVLEDLISNGNSYFKKLGKVALTRGQYEVSIVYFDNATNLFYNSDISLAKVSVVNGKIRYVVSQSSSAPLETLAVEPYSEAYENVTGKKFFESATQNSIN